MEVQIKTLNDLPGAAKQFLQLTEGKNIFAFKGEMGSGKTTFILSILRSMGIENPEGSPTFSLVNSYTSPLYGQVYHFDLYRLKDEEEAFDIGIEEMIYDDGICLIEWPEKIANLLPENVIWSYIRRNEDNSRTITIEI